MMTKTKRQPTEIMSNIKTPRSQGDANGGWGLVPLWAGGGTDYGTSHKKNCSASEFTLCTVAWLAGRGNLAFQDIIIAS